MHFLNRLDFIKATLVLDEAVTANIKQAIKTRFKVPCEDPARKQTNKNLPTTEQELEAQLALFETLCPDTKVIQ